jgi:hypothetical protein
MAGSAKNSGARASTIDPLEPLIFASRGLAILVLSLIGAGALATILGSGSLLTIGEDPICTTVSAGYEVPLRANESPAWSPSWGLAAGVSPSDEQYELCQDRPDGRTQLLSSLTQAPQMVFLLGFLAGVFILVRRARLSGLFSRQVARAVHWLGWYVLAGALVTSTVVALATSALVRQMVPAHDVLDLFNYLDLPVATLLAGAGLLTIARVLRLTVRMQEDLDATI